MFLPEHKSCDSAAVKGGRRWPFSPTPFDSVVKFLLSFFCSLIGQLDIYVITELIGGCVYTCTHLPSLFLWHAAKISLFTCIVFLFNTSCVVVIVFVLFVSSTAYCECTESDWGRYRMRGHLDLPHPPQVDFHQNPQKRLGPSPNGQHPSLNQGVLKGKLHVCFFF